MRRNYCEALNILAESQQDGQPINTVAAQCLAVGLGCRTAQVGKIKVIGSRKKVTSLSFWDDRHSLAPYAYNLAENSRENYRTISSSVLYRFISKNDPAPELNAGIVTDIKAQSLRDVILVDRSGTEKFHIFCADENRDQDSDDDIKFIKYFGWILLDSTADLEQSDIISILPDKFSNLFNFEHDINIVLNDDGAIIEANIITVDRLGYSIKELKSLQFKDILAMPRCNTANSILSSVKKNRSLCQQVILKSKCGELINADLCAKKIHFDGISAVRCLLRKITTQENLENRLREYEQVLFLEDDLISVVDTNYRYKAVNDAYLQRFEKTEMKLSADPLLQFMTPTYTQKL